MLEACSKHAGVPIQILAWGGGQGSDGGGGLARDWQQGLREQKNECKLIIMSLILVPIHKYIDMK